VIEESLEGGSGAGFDDVVGMDDEAHEAVAGEDERGLAFPDFDGVVVEDVEEGVVLDVGDGDFEEVADEVRHDGAAAAALRIEVGDVGDGHVVGEVELVEPVLIAVEDSGAETGGTEFAAVVVDFGDAFEELGAVVVEMAVVVEVVDGDFVAAGVDGVDVRVVNFVAFFGDDGEGALDAA